MLCILSSLPIVILYSINEDNNIYNGIGIFILLTFVAIGVFLFIHAGSIMNSYKELLQEDEYSRKTKKAIN